MLQKCDRNEKELEDENHLRFLANLPEISSADSDAIAFDLSFRKHATFDV